MTTKKINWHRTPGTDLVVPSDTKPAAIQNNLSTLQALGLPQGYSIAPWQQFGQQLSQPTTVFKNLRWYLVSNERQLLSEAYAEIGLIQAICDIPVDDGLRGGVTIKSKQLDESQIEELQVSMERDDDLNTAGTGIKWNRLYGGGGVLIVTDQDPSLPLDVEAIKPDSALSFRAVDMWELFWNAQNIEGYSPELQDEEFEYYDYYSKKLHKSRVEVMKGITTPSFIRPRLRGWGVSVVETLVRSINQYLKATDLTFEVLDEFKLDIYKIKNLTNSLLSPNAGAAVRRRIQAANAEKNFQSAITMDSEDDYIQKQLSFAGLAEVMGQIRMQVASDMRMPMSKLFGIGSQGFSSGEDDIENYNSMVESQVRNKCKFIILRMIELKCQKFFGFIPDDLAIEFEPLRILSAEQEENVKTQKFARLMQAQQVGLISEQEFRDACNKDNLFSVQLDTSEDLDSASDEGESVDDRSKDEDSGANEPDTRKPQLKSAPKPSTSPEVAPEAKT